MKIKKENLKKVYSYMVKDSDVLYLKKYLKGLSLEDGIKMLEQGIPVQYIVGDVLFYNYIFKVDKRVLIPRFETELLVDKLLYRIKSKFDKKISILDLCSGSGCIGITLDKEICSDVTCSDISSDALSVLRENKELNNSSVNIVLSDLFSNICGKFDVIVSNPPYIAYDEEVMDVVLNNEPWISLFAKDDGLYFYKMILKDIKKYLNDSFIVAFEIGMNQGKKVEMLVKKYLCDVNVSIEQDYNLRDRFIFISNK